jgi:hypothetical protein
MPPPTWFQPFENVELHDANVELHDANVELQAEKDELHAVNGALHAMKSIETLLFVTLPSNRTDLSPLIVFKAFACSSESVKLMPLLRLSDISNLHCLSRNSVSP